MSTSPFELEPFGPLIEDLESRRMRDAAGRALFAEDAPDLMRIGRFEIEGELGAGGQGAVYRVRDPKLGRQVALKRLQVTTAWHIDRLRQEARALAQVSHDNVVKIFEVDEDETGCPFLVMELVEGCSLQQWLMQERRHWTAVLEAFIAVGQGLAAIHAAGLVHRDVKPHNIIITHDGRAKLVDLGIAAAHAEEHPADTAANSGASPAGTWGYMAPEQLTGRVNARSDQFSFCVTLYEALHGVRPRSDAQEDRGPGEETEGPKGTTTAEEPSESPRFSPAEGLSQAPKALARVLERGLSPRPDDRHPQMTELVEALRRVLSRPRRWPLVLAAVAGAAVLGLAVALSPDEGPCARPESAVAWWDDHQRAEVRVALEATGSPEAAQAFATIDAAMGSTARALDERRAEVCANEDDPATHEVAMARILEQQGLLRSMAASLTTVEADEVVEVPGRLVASLGRLGGILRDACELGAVPSTSTASGVDVGETSARATALSVAGHYDDALRVAAEALARAEAEALASQRAGLHLLRGRLAFDARRLALARTELERARSLAESLGCDGVGAEALALWAKAHVLDSQPDLGAAESASQQALEKLDRLGDHDGPRRAEALNSRGLVARRLGRTDEAIAYYRDAIALRERLTPRPVLDLSDTVLNLGIAQAQQGQTQPAIETIERALELREQALWPEHPSLYRLHASLSYRYLEQGDFDAAEQAMTRALELAEGLGRDAHPRVAQLHVGMAQLLDRRHEFEQALDHARRADAILVDAVGEDDGRRLAALEAIGQVCLDAGWPERAIPALEQALALQGTVGTTDVDLAIGRGKLAHAHASMGQHETAAALFEQAQRTLGADPSLRSHPYHPELQLRYGESLVALDREREAIEPLRAAVAWWQERGDNPERLAIARWGLARALCAEGSRVEPARQALDYFESSPASGAAAMGSMIRAWLERPCAPAEVDGADALGATEPDPAAASKTSNSVDHQEIDRRP